ncbi:MAG TPA: alpha-L-fucosidase [Bacteroidales bacterium]|nr:alpha-L-fucosidase [Bacteroidales bacterium]
MIRKPNFSKRLIPFIMLLVTSWSLQAQKTAEPGMDKLWGDVTSSQSNKRPANAAWFANAKYAMFIHWGLFSQASNLWKGKTYYGIGEWIMKLSKSSISDYEGLAKEFNPVKFNAKEWVKLAKDAGMKYIIITAKHHEGFAMFKSSNPFNIVDATPFNRDPLKELADACKEAGLKLGFYYSQFQDWHEINSWSQDIKPTTFDEYFKNKSEKQVQELCTNYGPLLLMWFDTPGSMTKDQSLDLVRIVKENQPQALINSRIGNGVGDYSTYGDHEIPTKNMTGLWEAINTSNDSWGSAWYDENWKGPAEIVRDLISVIARGGNYMLNIGPRADGSIPETNADFLRISGAWIKQHQDAIYGAGASPWQKSLPWGDCTMTGNRLNLFVFDWKPGDDIFLPGLKTKIKSVTMNQGKLKLTFQQTEDGWAHITLPLIVKKELVEVINVEFDQRPEVNTTLGIDPVHPTILRADLAEVSKCSKAKASWMEKFGEWKHKPMIKDWTSPESMTSWMVDVKKAGNYFVNIEYNAWKEADGCEWDLVNKSGRKLRIYTTESTGASMEVKSRFRFRNVRVGVLELNETGMQELKLCAASLPKGGGIQLYAIYLTPVE